MNEEAVLVASSGQVNGSSFFEVKRSVDAAIVMSNFQIMIFIIKQYQHKIQQNY